MIVKFAIREDDETDEAVRPTGKEVLVHPVDGNIRIEPEKK